MKFRTLLLAFVANICAVAYADKAQNITNYIATTYPCQVTNVEVGADKVTITGNCPADGQFAIVDITPADDPTETTTWRTQEPVTGQQFSITVDRKVKYDGIGYDRIFSRWAVVETTTGATTLASHARYADKTPILSSPAELVPTTKKGVGAGLGQVYMDDLVELGAKNITCNMVMNWYIAKSPIYARNIEYTYNGQKYYLNGDEIASWDWHLKFYEDHGIAVSAIVLITPNSVDPALSKVFCHPDNNGGHYTMPNMTNMESINAYAAVLEYFASRYNGTGHGRINHWIMHNEVDMGSTWTNMGTQPEMVYTNEYMKSMRLCYNIVRQYDQHASIMGSFTHNWTTTSGGNFPSKTMLEHMVEMSKCENDFLWGVAQHPYPQNLTRPKFWIDDSQATGDMDTKYITFKNLEVLNQWILMPENMINGKIKRKLFLSENGTNSPSYSELDLKNQAAGGAWAWKKTKALPGIDAFMWHNWMDNRVEDGLRIGLHFYPDDETNPGGKKPVWYVWQAADSDQESEVLDPYLETLGVKEWKEIFLLIKGEGNKLENGHTYNIEAEDYDLGGKGIAYDSHNTTGGSDYRADNDGVNLTAYSLLENGWGIYDMGGSWQTYNGRFIDDSQHTISHEMAEENWGSWFTYTIEALEDVTANIFVKHAALWRDYGNAAATGCAPGPDTYIVEDAPALNWPKHYAGAMVISLDGENLYTTQVARPIAPDEYQSRGTNFNQITTHPDRWTSTLNGKEKTDTLWVWSRAGGNNSQSSFCHDDPDYRNIFIPKGKHVIKVKSISSPWNFDCLRFDCYAPTSGITALDATAPVIITAGHGCINVAGANTDVSIYSLNGMLMGHTRDTMSLPAGIYIARHGSNATKVKVN
ncbi:MAG: DUF5722 domain-containing protein [Muribaculaceae bacterium]|nr:DUF5722 domain-containing protein [Muribaculaceae bacterium]